MAQNSLANLGLEWRQPPSKTKELGLPEKTIDAFLCLPLSFALVDDKRYQRKEPLISSVHTKVKGIAEVREEILENGKKEEVHSVLDTADYTFPLQVSTGQHLPRMHPYSLSPGPGALSSTPSPGTESLTPEKYCPYLKSSVKIPMEKT